MIAVISDIHGNLEALEAVLRDAAQESATTIVSLGDVVGYGADPNACVERVLSVATIQVRGNHDTAVCDLRQADSFNEVAKAAIQWTAAELTSEYLGVLESIPLECTDHGARYVHASPFEPASWHYIVTEQEAWDAFGSFHESLCFVGHSHVPLRVLLRDGRLEVHEGGVLQLDEDVRALVNVGSVGQPRDGDWRASYVIYDPDRQRVIHRRVEYDLEAASEKIRAAGLPEILAHRLAQGQ